MCWGLTTYYTPRFDCHKLPIFTLIYGFSATYLHGDTHIAGLAKPSLFCLIYIEIFYLYEEAKVLIDSKSQSSLQEWTYMHTKSQRKPNQQITNWL